MNLKRSLLYSRDKYQYRFLRLLLIFRLTRQLNDSLSENYKNHDQYVSSIVIIAKYYRILSVIINNILLNLFN